MFVNAMHWELCISAIKHVKHLNIFTESMEVFYTQTMNFYILMSERKSLRILTVVRLLRKSNADGVGDEETFALLLVRKGGD